MTKTMFQYTQPNCRKAEDNKHAILWDYKEPEFEDEMVHFRGKCLLCGLEFMDSYQSTGKTIIGKNLQPYNFDKETHEVFTQPFKDEVKT